MTSVQRRRWERVRKALDVIITARDGATSHGRTQDLCEGGLGIVSAGPLVVGADYGFTIAEIAPTPLAGAVRWSTPRQSQGDYLIGVEFTSLTRSQTAALADRLADWKAQDAGADDV